MIDAVNGATNNTDSAAANTVVEITYAAAVGIRHIIAALFCSYSAAPTGGRLTIEDGAGTIIFDIDITASGDRAFAFSPALRGSANTAMIVTLYAAGGGVVGKLNVPGHITQG